MEKKRRIVFVNQATGYLAIDIINAFAPSFDMVAVIYGDIRVQDVELAQNVEKSKVIEKTRNSNIARFFRWLVATIQIFFLLATKYRKYEIFYFSVPPFAYMNSMFFRRKFSILMWDVYPDALKIINIDKSNILYRLWSNLNKKLFKRAFRIYTIGESLKDLLAQYIEPEKIKVIQLWSGITNIIAVAKVDNPFVMHHHLEEKFIIQYSGNLGPTYNIEALVETACLTASDKDILYIIIGRGIKFHMAKKMAFDNKLDNVLFLPFQSDDMIRYSLAAADISVVLIDEKVATSSIPSKVYNLLAIGSPIISISPDNTEINKLITKYGIGKNFSKDDFTGMADFIREMKGSPEILKRYQKNSLDASANFTMVNANKFVTDYLN